MAIAGHDVNQNYYLASFTFYNTVHYMRYNFEQSEMLLK